MQILPIGPLVITTAPVTTSPLTITNLAVPGNTGIVPPWLVDRANETKLGVEELVAS